MGIPLRLFDGVSRARNFASIAFFILACRGNEAPAPSNQTPVILISIDTLRSDHLPAYGYKGVETPNLDAFRRDAILYEHAYSHVPLTLPSHATMLTGRLPVDTGVRDNLGFTLRQDIPTLAELLKKNGYQTGAAVSSFVMRGSTGLSRGFDFYEDLIDAGTERLNPGAVQRSGSDTARIAMDWMNANQDGPFFFLLHLFEPHTPYDPPEPFRARYAAAPYDGEIAAADAIVGSVLDFLKERDLYDRSLILVLSDHGEGLMDHGEDEHGIFLYREAIQVPLLLKLPGSRLRGTIATTSVQLSDVFPTIASQTNSSFEKSELHGESLLNFTGRETPRPIFSESWFAAIHFGWSDLHSLIDGRHHFIRAPALELYDVRDDPAERSNIAQEERRTVAAMQKVLEPFIAPPAAPQTVDPEEARKLAALGYLGNRAGKLGTATRSEEPAGHSAGDEDCLRPFPRRERQRSDSASSQTGQGKSADAGYVGRAGAQSFPHAPDGESIQAAKTALQISPRSPQFAILVSNAALELGHLDEALAHAELLEDNTARGVARVRLANFPRSETIRIGRGARHPRGARRWGAPARASHSRQDRERAGASAAGHAGCRRDRRGDEEARDGEAFALSLHARRRTGAHGAYRGSRIRVSRRDPSFPARCAGVSEPDVSLSRAAQARCSQRGALRAGEERAGAGVVSGDR